MRYGALTATLSFTSPHGLSISERKQKSWRLICGKVMVSVTKA
jgi:hypothetical protein